jgi:hypothetical protein
MPLLVSVNAFLKIIAGLDIAAFSAQLYNIKLFPLCPICPSTVVLLTIFKPHVVSAALPDLYEVALA